MNKINESIINIFNNLKNHISIILEDGKIIYIEQNNWFVKDEKGNIVAIEGIGRDITERKILEESLRESEKKFRFLFEYATIGITLTDKNGELLYCNPKW